MKRRPRRVWERCFWCDARQPGPVNAEVVGLRRDIGFICSECGCGVAYEGGVLSLVWFPVRRGIRCDRGVPMAGRWGKIPAGCLLVGRIREEA